MSEKSEGLAGCGCFIAMMVFNLALGGISVDYCLWALCDKDVPMWVDIIVGVFLAEITLPLMVICWLLKMVGAL